jgi:hypothetical protein
MQNDSRPSVRSNQEKPSSLLSKSKTIERRIYASAEWALEDRLALKTISNEQ